MELISNDEIFDAAFDYLMVNEGGFINHPLDKGGPTNFGITLNILRSLHSNPIDVEDLKELTQLEAKGIYRSLYWDPYLKEMPNKLLGIIFFDQLVNRGPAFISNYVLKITGTTNFLNPKILNFPINTALNFYKYVILSYCRLVLKEPHQGIFLIGWINRAHRMLDLIEKCRCENL